MCYHIPYQRARAFILLDEKIPVPIEELPDFGYHGKPPKRP